MISSKQHTIISGLSLFIILLAPFQLCAQNTIASAIKNNERKLHYPQSVARFYQQNGYRLAWIVQDTIKTHVWEAMMLLDCADQYGLIQADYHPKQLQYDKLHCLIEQQRPYEEKVTYDIMLSDAIICFMNNLHYGKLNPVYTRLKIDKGTLFKAEKELLNAINSKDFSTIIDNVQPKSKQYSNIRNHMHLLVGLRSGDCYIIPETLIRKMAINMERLRWRNTTGKQVHLTLIVRRGLVINFKDTYKYDMALEEALYNENQLSKSTLKTIRSLRIPLE
jgi:hypothetical protein